MTADEFGVAELFAQGIPAEALARHATELGEKLKARLEDLDRREAMLHGQEAELDSRIRSARLWLEERESELDAREEAIENNAAQARLGGQLDHAAKVDEALQLEERERQLPRLQTELELIQAEMAEKLNELDIQTASCQSKQEELTATRRQFEDATTRTRCARGRTLQAHGAAHHDRGVAAATRREDQRGR